MATGHACFVRAVQGVRGGHQCRGAGGPDDACRQGAACAHAAPPGSPTWFCLLLPLAASHHSVAADSEGCVHDMQLMDEMRTKGLSANKNTYLAALNALAETSRIEVCLPLHASAAHCHARLRSTKMS